MLAGALIICKTIVLRLLCVAVETLQLVDEGLGHRVQWSHLVRRDRYIDIVQILYHWLELLVFYSVQGLDHAELLIGLFVLFDLRLHRSKMLLERHIDVVKEWALSRQE